MLSAVEVFEFDEEGGGDDLGIEGFEELDGSSCRAACGEKVIDEEDFFAGFDGIGVDFDGVFAVFEGVGHGVDGPGEFAFFTDGDEAGVEDLGDSGGEDEAAGVDADDFVDFFALGGIGKELKGGFEEGGVSEDGGDVLEEDSGLGEIGDVPDGGVEVCCGGHGGDARRNSGKGKVDIGRDSLSALERLGWRGQLSGHGNALPDWSIRFGVGRSGLWLAGSGG